MSHADAIHNRTIQLRRMKATRHPRLQTHPILVKESAPAEVVEANLALASDILVLPSAFLVGKRKPVEELPQPWRWLARKVYQYTGWASDYGLECQAICTTEEMADQMIAEHPNWFKQKLPINTPLPDETCKFELMTFPKSDAASLYDKRRAPFEAVSREDKARELARLATLDNKLGRLQDSIEGKSAKAS